ncbi:MAG: trypsin-like serine peptidase [Gammaproteobacteria bacterium]
MNQYLIAMGLACGLWLTPASAVNTIWDEPVSSDGSVPELTSTDTQHAVKAFAGRRKPGTPLDALAEFPAEVVSLGERNALAEEFKPLIPWYAEYEGPRETVLGYDSRYRLYTTTYPERAIGLLTFNQSGSSFICTGFLIGPDTVATAGHCVHEGNGGNFSTNVRFYPGRNVSSPFGSCSARRLFTVGGWSQSGSPNFDYGAVKLNCRVGNTVGWFGYFWQSATLVGLPVQISGYPSDKPFGTHWSTSGDIEISEVFRTRYRHDTAGGQSGAPVFETDRRRAFCQGPCVNTIHTNGVFDGRNSGTRITQAVFNNLTAWRNAP